MKWFLLILAVLSFESLPAAENPLYQKEISYSSPELAPSAKALAEKLKLITGEDFSLLAGPIPHAESQDSIQLWTAEEAATVPGLQKALEKLNAKNREAFVIDSDSERPGLRIVGASDVGVRHGVYRYLQELGYRSLFPGKHWQIVPKKENIRVSLSLSETPHYTQRTFFGTGGFHTRLPLDPNAEIAKMWSDWRDANLFGESFNLGGHYGETFIHKHRNTLEEHPEYRAMVNGERVPLSAQFQLNYGNPELRTLYINDRVQHLAQNVSRDPSRTYCMSVEPADGAGHCESPEATALGPISDRVYGLANEVAKKIQEEFPGHFVNLFAYNMHANVPAFPLEENVIVSIIPYGFNRAESLIGDDLLLAWKEKASIIGIYDYWALPDWSKGMPQLDFLGEVPRKLKLWTDNNVRFFNAETTTGAGTAGITLYLTAKMLWNPDTDYNKELNNFYKQAFGPAQKPMQRMLERWASGFTLQDNELGMTFRDLQDAYKLAQGHPDIQARIEDFITYAEYLRLLWEFEITEKGTEQRIAAADALMRFLWQIRENAMVQTFRITQLMLNVWMKGEEAFREKWDFTTSQAAGWGTVKEYPTPEEVSDLLVKGVKTYPVLFEPRRFSSDLESYSKPESIESVESYRMIRSPAFTFQAHQEGPLELQVHFGNRENAIEKGVITITDTDSGKTIYRDAKPLDDTWHTFQIPVRGGVNYDLRIYDRSAHFQIRFPSNISLVLTEGVAPINWTSVKNWFFVPTGTQRFAILIHGNPVKEKTVVHSEDETLIQPLLNKAGFSVYDVPPGQDGKVWTIEKFRTNQPIQLINIPNNLSFSKETLMVPKEALE